MRQRTVRHRVEGWIDPATVFASLCAGRDRAFWLDSGAYTETGMSYLGVGSSTMTSVVEDHSVKIDRHLPGRPAGTVTNRTVFDELRSSMPARMVLFCSRNSPLRFR